MSEIASFVLGFIFMAGIAILAFDAGVHVGKAGRNK